MLKGLNMNEIATSNSETTRILLAAAHLHNEEIYQSIRQRYETNYSHKADTPEKFLDITAIQSECEKARTRERIRNLLLLPTALVGIIGFQSDISWVILTIFSLWAIELTTEWFRQKYVRGNFLSRDVSKDSESVGKDDKQNVVISGDYSPFVGSVYDIHGWSFTVDTKKPQQHFEPIKELDIKYLYLETCGDIEKLNIPGILITDKLFVNGRDIRFDKDFLIDILMKPSTRVDNSIIKNT